MAARIAIRKLVRIIYVHGIRTRIGLGRHDTFKDPFLSIIYSIERTHECIISFITNRYYIIREKHRSITNFNLLPRCQPVSRRSHLTIHNQ